MKSLINSRTVEANQISPMKYPWAWEHYQNGNANHWLPQEVPMNKDIELWKSGRLTEDEKRVILRNLGFFSTAESIVGNNLVLAVYQYIHAAECRQYLLRQAYEEAIHTETFHYIVESLGLSHDEVFGAYKEIESIGEKDEFQMKLTEDLLHGKIDTTTLFGKQKLLENLIGFYVIMEGIFFYSGFAMILSMHRQNKMIGIGEQFQLILRDESIHLNFGIDLINGIKNENPECWTGDFKIHIQEMIEEAVRLEILYAKDCLPKGILGLNVSMFEEYVRYIANRRLERIELPKMFDGVSNPFAWMSEAIDLQKEKNFFETRVTEYQNAGGLQW